MVKRILPTDIDTLARMSMLARIEHVRLKPMPRSGVEMIAYRDGSPGRYIVSGDSCTCPAYQMRGYFCKHRAKWIDEHIADYKDSLFDAIAERESAKMKEGA